MAGYPGYSGNPASRQQVGMGLTGVSGRAVAPVNPYDSIPPLQPVDSSWYQRELDRLNKLAVQQAQQAKLFGQQSSQQYADFAAQYQRERDAMMPEARPRVSRMYMLGGY